MKQKKCKNYTQYPSLSILYKILNYMKLKKILHGIWFSIKTLISSWDERFISMLFSLHIGFNILKEKWRQFYINISYIYYWKRNVTKKVVVLFDAICLHFTHLSPTSFRQREFISFFVWHPNCRNSAEFKFPYLPGNMVRPIKTLSSKMLRANTK